MRHICLLALSLAQRVKAEVKKTLSGVHGNLSIKMGKWSVFFQSVERAAV